MFVEDLNGDTYDWKIKGKEVIQDRRPRSKLHVVARKLIKARFPTMQVLEEVSFKTYPKKTLFFDFYIPIRRLAIEVNGEQHYAFSSMYHDSRQDFLRQRKNDADKEEWCDINGIDLIILPFNTADEWKEII